MTKKYFQLNPEQRYQIAALLKAGHSNGFVAAQLGIHRCTVGRELKRNSTSKQRYQPVLAQQFVNDRQKDKKHFPLFSTEMKTFLENKMRSDQWSPEQINGYCKANGIPMVSHEWIYQYVYNDLKDGGQLYTHLRTQNKRRRKRTHRKDKRGLIANRISIHQRPAIVAKKLNAGYYFADPYSSWQRGLNEYTNKLYRQYLPKKSNLNHYDIQYFVDITNKLNTRPRKLLGYQNPLQVFMANFKPN